MEKKMENEMETGIIMVYRSGLYRQFSGVLESTLR